VRLFIAIEIPDTLKEALAALQLELKQARASLSWIRPENIHLTIKFLGEVGEDRLDDVVRVTAAAASNSPPAELGLSEIGVFDERRPRVVWAGLKGDLTVVERLRSDLDERLGEAGFARESRPLRPHLTIGRFKAPRGARELIALASGYALPDVSFLASEIVVVQSKLHPQGARYTVLSKARLGG
jgi:RNA 2',3'-cyclic 3'-phosphodiesterase